MTLNLLLARLLILAVHLAPVEARELHLHVITAGVYTGSYVVERNAEGHLFFKKQPEASELSALEAERSRRYGQFYTVWDLTSGESQSVNITDVLRDLKPLRENPTQKLGGADPLRLDLAGRLLFLGSETEQVVVVLEKPSP